MQHSEGKFSGHNNANLYYQSWSPDGIPFAVLIVVHGMAEHCGRYMNLVNYFVPRGYAVYSFDLRGHGKSEGKYGYVERFSYYLEDLKIFCNKVMSENDSTKIFMVGHSMGATITIAYALDHQAELDGIMVSGSVLKAGASITKLAIFMARVLSVILPKMGVSQLDSSTISRDQAVVDAYVSDPLVYSGKISARLGAELLGMIEKLPARIPELSLPVLVMHGSDDRLSDPAGSQMLFDLARSHDKTLKMYEGFYHEIFNEPQRDQVFADMSEWLKWRI